MTCEDVLKQLEAWGSEKSREAYARLGAGENQFGVGLSPLRALANKLRRNHPLAMELWATGNTDAMLLATLIMDRKQLSAEQVDAMIQPLTYSKLVDWLVENVVRHASFEKQLRPRWLESSNQWVARAGWSLLVTRVLADDKSLEHDVILRRIEAEMKDAPVPVQEPMNRCLVEIATSYPEHLQRGIDIGTRLEVFKTMRVSKGCTSPYAPEWIALVLGRKQAEAAR